MSSTNRSGRRTQAGRKAAPEAAKKAEVRGASEASPKQGDKGNYARGYFVGVGIVAGTILGMPIGLATANPGMVWAGLAIGTMLGTAYEQKYNRGLSALVK